MTKKIVAIALTLVMLASVFAVFTVTSSASTNIWLYEVDKTTSVSSQRQKIAVTRLKTYSVSYSGTAASTSYADNAARLTDGSAGTGTSYQSAFTGNGTTSIVINVGSKTIGFTDFYARFLYDSTYSFVLPTSVKFYVSEDGTTYNYAGEGVIPTSASEDTAYSIGFTKERGCAAQYVKVEIAHNGIIAVSEVSAYIWADVVTIADTGKEDNQGVVYTANVSAGTAYVSSYTNTYTTTETIQGVGITPCSASGNVNNTSYVIGKGSETEVTVKADFVSSSRSNRSGEVVWDKRYVVIHCTGNYGSTATAYANHRYQTTNSACTSTSWHYTVGADGIYQGLPDNEVGWHASGGHYSLSNYNGIGVETCVNGFPGNYNSAEWTTFLNNTFYLNCRRAAMLTAELCIRWNLNPGDCSLGTAVRQHYDTVQSGGYQKNCPEQMRYNKASGTYTRDTGDLWVYYKGKVQEYYKMLKGGGTTTVTKEVANKVTSVEIPQYVYVSSSNAYCKVTGVASKAFNSKSNLVSVYLPNTIAWGAAATAFESSANLVNVNVSPTNTYVYSKGGVLYSSADNTVLATPAKNSGAGVAKADPVVYALPNFTLDTPYEGGYDANIDTQRFKGLAKGISATELTSMFVDKVTVYNADGSAMAGTDVVGTGCYMKSEDGYDTCVIVIPGDIDGTGKVNATDYVALKSCLKKEISLTGVYLEAASLSGSGTVSAIDCIAMINKIKYGV